MKSKFFLIFSVLIFLWNPAFSATKNIQPSGKIIGYLPGWVNPAKLPAPQDLQNAGYTHIIIAFGLFSTSTPGQVVTDFPSITPSYISQLQAKGIKVLFSLGGALTSVPNTTVSFDQALQAATTPQQFQKDLVASIETIEKQYGFDGIDFDIEQGFNAGGTFLQPQGDIGVLANIINQLHADNSKILISLVPQVDNIAATSSFANPWATYSSLVMQTYQSLSWVGIQLYNTGCANGIDDVCYADTGGSQDFSVAMATDLLENWPAKDPSGRDTGFLPYVSYLKPEQVVLGYPAPNSVGVSDGGPVTANANIKNAIQCLRTGKSCGQFIPPHQYPTIGGVFDWEVTYDEDNHYQFASQLKQCVLQNNC